MSTKKRLRQSILELRDSMPEADRRGKSLVIECRLLSLPEYKLSQMPMVFCSFGSEVKTEGIIKYSLENGKRVLVPKVCLKSRSILVSELKDYEKDLVLSPPYGIPEPREEQIRPVCPTKLDLIIVPGVVFDRQGGRIGYGAGFYDRFLDRIPTEVCRLALAFALQIVDKVPHEVHDKLVDVLVTENEVLYFNNRPMIC